MIINYCGPILVIVTAPLFFRERLTWQKGVALALAMTGACLISGQTAAAGGSVWGLVCAGLSAVTYAIMVISNKLSRHIVGMENALLQMGFTLVTVMVFVGFRGGLAMDIPAGDWPFILWLGLLNTGVGCYCYFSTIRRPACPHGGHLRLPGTHLRRGLFHGHPPGGHLAGAAGGYPAHPGRRYLWGTGVRRRRMLKLSRSGWRKRCFGVCESNRDRTQCSGRCPRWWIPARPGRSWSGLRWAGYSWYTPGAGAPKGSG